MPTTLAEGQLYLDMLNGWLYWLDASGTIQKTELKIDVAGILVDAALTGTPTAPTPPSNDDSDKIATTEFVADSVSTAISAAISNLIAGAPGALDTLKELADAIGDDANYAATITNALAGKVANARRVTGSGLATGGGDLSADRTINVPASTTAQAQAGTDTTTAMTPAATKAAVQQFAPAAGQPIPGYNVLGVGCIALCINTTTGVTQGNQTSGSNLQLAHLSTSGTWSGGSTQTGTWKNIGGYNSVSGDVLYWLRTA